MEDIIDYIMRYIVSPFMCVLMVGVVLFCIMGVLCIPSCIKQDIEEKNKIEECFMQEPRTKECEFTLWKYELKMGNPKKTRSTTFVPMVIR